MAWNRVHSGSCGLTTLLEASLFPLLYHTAIRLSIFQKTKITQKFNTIFTPAIQNSSIMPFTNSELSLDIYKSITQRKAGKKT